MAPLSRTAWDILTDESRAYTILNERDPESLDGAAPPFDMTFLDDIRAFHDSTTFMHTRFEKDYKALCKRLDYAMQRLEIWLHGLALLPSKVEPGKWHLNVLYKGKPVERTVMPYSRHHEWYLLHKLRTDLARQKNPTLQRTLFAHLPHRVKSRIVRFLAPEDVRKVATMNAQFRDICSAVIDKHGRVSMWYSHVTMPRNELLAMMREIQAPPTTFGSSIAALWAWFRERDRTRRSPRTLFLTLVNRWSWADKLTAEARWLSMPTELKAWQTCFYCGTLSMQRLRDLRLDHLAITADMVYAFSVHPTLRGLDLDGCGLPWPEETKTLPQLPRIRRLRLAWDPDSAFETAVGVRLLTVIPNIVQLRLSNRRKDSPYGLTLGNNWSGGAWCALRVLAITGVNTAFATTVLRNCRSRVLHSVVLRLQHPGTDADTSSFLQQVFMRSSGLETLVLDGCPAPSAVLLRAIARSFPVLRDLAIIPRLTAINALGPVDVADNLGDLADLERLCLSGALAQDGIAATRPGDLSGSEVGPSGGAERGTRNEEPVGALASKLALVLPSMREVTFRFEDVVHSIAIHRTGTARNFILEPLIPVSPLDDDLWWT